MKKEWYDAIRSKSIVDQIKETGYYFDKENNTYIDADTLYDEAENLQSQILGEIDRWSAKGEGKFGIHYKEKLDEFLQEYSKEEVFYAIGIAPEEYKEDAQHVLYYSGDQDKLSKALQEFETYLNSYFEVYFG